MVQIERRSIFGNDPDLARALLEEHLPVGDLGDAGRHFFRFTLGDLTVGYGGYERAGDAALLRSIVVIPGARGSGVGRHIAEALIEEVRLSGSRQLFLLTQTAAGFFQHMGFKPIDRADAPAAILATQQASSLCASVPLFIRAVDAH